MKLLETIRYESGMPDNLSCHQERVNRSRRELLQCRDELPLEKLLPEKLNALTNTLAGNGNANQLNDDAIFKCRILYAEDIEEITLTPYKLPEIRSLQVVYDDQIEYAYKYADRKPLEKLFGQRGIHDDILIVRKGQVTDTYFTNILFFDGKSWVTPDQPLLKGTRRESLLRQGIVEAKQVGLNDLYRFEKARLVNAMIRFEDCLDIHIRNIIL